jgi:AhpD family alkylhydroperoxidase
VKDSTVKTRIPLLEREQVSPELAGIYDALLNQRGVVPNMFKTIAHAPPLAAGILALLKPLLGDGALAGWYKELIATRMSALNGSDYAVSAHSLSALQKGASEEQIAAVRNDFEQGPFTASEKLGLRCAEKIHRSGRDLDDSSFTELQHAYNDAQIVELIATAAVFEFFPRLVDGLQIPVTPLPGAK